MQTTNPNSVLTMSNKEMEVVKGLDLKRYMGRWYEIASFPSRFQPSDGVNTRATYTLNEDGTVKVLNETWSGGKRGYIEGFAYKANPNSDEAKLKVKFWVPPFLPIIPVVGDYWVLFIDDGYHYALIGQPSRKYLWVTLFFYLILLLFTFSSFSICIIRCAWIMFMRCDSVNFIQFLINIFVGLFILKYLLESELYCSGEL